MEHLDIWICVIAVVIIILGCRRLNKEKARRERRFGTFTGYAPPSYDYTPSPKREEFRSPTQSRINDHAGNLRARIVTHGSKSVIYDHAGNYHGYYDSSTDRTYNHAGNIVAQGNVLATLIP